MRGRYQALLWATALVVLLATIASLACGEESPTTKDVQREVEQALAPGTTVNDIRAYLASNKNSLELRDTSQGEVSKAAGSSDLIEEYGLDPNTPVYVAAKNSSTRTLIVDFVLDKDLRFQRAIVIEYRNLP